MRQVHAAFRYIEVFYWGIRHRMTGLEQAAACFGVSHRSLKNSARAYPCLSTGSLRSGCSTLRSRPSCRPGSACRCRPPELPRRDRRLRSCGCRTISRPALLSTAEPCGACTNPSNSTAPPAHPCRLSDTRARYRRLAQILMRGVPRAEHGRRPGVVPFGTPPGPVWHPAQVGYGPLGVLVSKRR